MSGDENRLASTLPSCVAGEATNEPREFCFFAVFPELFVANTPDLKAPKEHVDKARALVREMEKHDGLAPVDLDLKQAKIPT